jgi:gamma-glutamyltranspeptidase/glutathione hydrolase
MTSTRLPVAVAAGNTVTADVGAQILRQGGTAADAAVAMVLTSCVAETLFTGLGGGGFATYFDAATGTTTCLDFFVAVPGLAGQRRVTPHQIAIDFGGQHVPYAVGAATVAVPGVPAGVEAMHRRWGRLEWHDVVRPALEHARHGVSFAPVHSKVLATVAPAMLIGEGLRVYGSPGGGLLPGGGRLFHRGLDNALQLLAEQGAAAFYRGEIADAMVAAVGDQGDLGSADLLAYAVVETTPRSTTLGGCQVLARGDDLDDLLGTIAALTLSDDPADLAEALTKALRAAPRRGDTTSLAAADAEGNACAVTTSLGLSSGIWLTDLGIHLNSMLGEGELVRGTEVPGRRMGSMMSPLVALEDGRPVLVAGAAGGSRIRSALLQVLVNVLHRGMPAQDAISAPRLNPVPGRVHVEPGFPPEVHQRLGMGDEVVEWPARDSYFGGVAAIGLLGAGADPRRGGEVHRLDEGAS